MCEKGLQDDDGLAMIDIVDFLASSRKLVVEVQPGLEVEDRHGAGLCRVDCVCSCKICVCTFKQDMQAVTRSRRRIQA